jgi:DegV family protein with EDD domain
MSLVQETPDYQIFTDATADLPDEVADALGITILPMIVEMAGHDYTIGGKEGNITISEFYERLIKGEVARTSQINSSTYYRYLTEALERGQDVLLISFSSGLSKSYEVGVSCVEKLRKDYPDRKVISIDSLCASVGEGALAYCAAMKKRNGMGIDELAAWIEDNKLRMIHWFTLDDLSYLQRGGRISMASAAVGTMLNIKPILHVNNEGMLVSVHKVRGRKKAIDMVVDIFVDTFKPGNDEQVFIGYGTSMQEAVNLKDTIIAKTKLTDIPIYQVGPIIGAHTGPSMLSVFYFGEKR